MSQWVVIGMMVLAGTLMSFQAPINAALRTHVGVLESALVSFTVGTVILIGVVSILRQGDLGAVRKVAWWQLLGGVIGAVFVTATLLSARKIGITMMIVAALVGQLVGAVLIDLNGWFGVPARPIDGRRFGGIILVVLAILFMNWEELRAVLRK
jgi:transporter family-2 protein